MEFIIDYSKTKDEIETIVESIIEPIIEPEIDPTIEPILYETQPLGTVESPIIEQEETETPVKKSKASKKQLDNLQKAREKAKESIKRNKHIKEEYLTNQLMHYQNKVNEKMKLLNQKPPDNSKYKIHKPTNLDILFDKFF